MLDVQVMLGNAEYIIIIRCYIHIFANKIELWIKLLVHVIVIFILEYLLYRESEEKQAAALALLFLNLSWRLELHNSPENMSGGHVMSFLLTVSNGNLVSVFNFKKQSLSCATHRWGEGTTESRLTCYHCESPHMNTTTNLTKVSFERTLSFFFNASICVPLQSLRRDHVSLLWKKNKKKIYKQTWASVCFSPNR